MIRQQQTRRSESRCEQTDQHVLTHLERSVARELRTGQQAQQRLEDRCDQRHDDNARGSMVLQQDTNSGYQRFQYLKQVKVAEQTDIIRAIKEGRIADAQMVCEFAPANANVTDRVSQFYHHCYM